MVKLLSPTSLSKARRSKRSTKTSPRRKGRPAKGSAAAKAMMAKVRAAKKGKRKSPTRKSRSPTAVASPATLSTHHMKGGKNYSPTTLSARRRSRKSPTRKGRKSPTRKSRKSRK